MEIRVLALNDDNHATHFYSEDETIDMSASEMISFLAQAHSINYNIRGVYVCDMPEGELFENAFDVVFAGVRYMTYEEAFVILWAVSQNCVYM